MVTRDPLLTTSASSLLLKSRPYELARFGTHPLRRVGDKLCDDERCDEGAISRRRREFGIKGNRHACPTDSAERGLPGTGPTDPRTMSRMGNTIEPVALVAVSLALICATRFSTAASALASIGKSTTLRPGVTTSA